MTNPYSAPNAQTEGLPAAAGNITGAMLEALRGTRGWVKLVGVLLLISAAIVAFSAVAIALGGASMRGLGGAGSTGSMAAMMGMGAVYMIFAVLYIILGLHLVRYAGAIKRLLVDGNADTMVEALQHQQKFWRLAGGLALIGLIFMVIGLIGVVAAFVIPAMAR